MILEPFNFIGQGIKNRNFAHKCHFKVKLSILWFRMTSAFIWCIYCLCRQKIMKFQNFVVSKLKFFVIKLGTFSRLVWKYYETYGCFQRLCGCLKISAFIWDHFWLIRVTNMHSTAHDICRAESAPPPNHTHTKKPELDRVKWQKH